MVQVTNADLGLAFGLVLAAGASTAIGAAGVFCVKQTNFKVLAFALGASAGVMMYVSFVEIFATKSVSGFRDAGYAEQEAYRYATLCFFAGMVVLWLLDKVTHALLHLGQALKCKQQQGKLLPTFLRRNKAGDVEAGNTIETSNSSSTCVTVAADAAATIDMAPAAPPAPASCSNVCCKPTALNAPALCCTPPAPVTACAHGGGAAEAGQQLARGSTCSSGASGPNADLGVVEVSPPGVPEAVITILNADHHAGLGRMGLLAALAIGLHNFPEGLATFVGTLADPRAGIAIAVAIALHNIPEGIVVAMPIYYSTGSAKKAFLWGCLSGITEPIGALLGWAILHGNDLNPMVYALMFGLVAGMMIYISITELLPTALKYDPDDSYTTRGVIVGMVVMAASLLAFAASN